MAGAKHEARWEERAADCRAQTRHGSREIVEILRSSHG